MYKKEFESKLPNLRAKALLLFGEESYFIKKYSSIVAEKIAAKEQRVVHYFEEYDFEGAKNYLSQASLFGDKNLYILKHSKPIAKRDLQALLEITKKSPNSYFIYELYGNEGKKIAPLFGEKNEAIHVRFFKASLQEAKSELAKFAQEIGLTISPSSIEHLLLLLDNNIEMGMRELEKLRSFSESVQNKEIDTLVYPLNPLNLEKLYLAIIEKKPIDTLLMQIEQEQNEMKILLGLQNYIYQLFLFYTYIRLHGHVDSSKILGYKLPRFVEDERARVAMKIKNYPQIFLTLQECEYELKTRSNIDRSSTLLSYLIKLQALF